MKDLVNVKSFSSTEKEVVQINFKQISSRAKGSLKDNNKLTDILMLQEAALVANILDYNGKWDRKANQFTADSKKRFIEADKLYYSLVGKNMVINSGTRDVFKQAELYIKYNYHGQGNPASWPGCSLHNWGVAADMIRTHERELVQAMKKAGWTRTVAGEPWHFECTSSGDHQKAARKIKEFRKSPSGLAFKWSGHVASFYAKTRDFNKRAPIYNQRLQNQRDLGQKLQNEIANYNREVNNLKARIAKFNKDINFYNSEIQRGKNLYSEIINMPAGPARDRKIREYNALTEWLEKESSRIDYESVAIQNEQNRIASWENLLDKKISQYKQEQSWLDAEFQSLSKIERESKDHQSNAISILNKINQAAKP